ncbi:MAG TPA: hypothetical protein VD907_04485 [Verrucomicrobiae bacterium]|nr:hypothetical protein [Verrucomicrobiae bacterium]
MGEGIDPTDEVDAADDKGLRIAYDAKSLKSAAQNPKAKPRILGYGLVDEMGFLYFPSGNKLMRLFPDEQAAQEELGPKITLKVTDVDLSPKEEVAIRRGLNTVLYMALHGVDKGAAEKAVRQMQLTESVKAIRDGHASFDDALLAQAWPHVRPLLQRAFRALDAWSVKMDQARAVRLSDRLEAESARQDKAAPARKRRGPFGQH